MNETPKLDEFIAMIETFKTNPYTKTHDDRIWIDMIEVLKEIKAIIQQVKVK